MAKITIKDVAKMAGVCTSTVSRVLSGSKDISDATCEKVHEAVKKLNYTPNSAARSLRCDKTHSIGVVFPDISGEFYALCASALLKYAREAGYTVLFTESGHNMQSEKAAVNALLERCVDGMIFIGDGNDNSLVNEIFQRSIPVVTGDRKVMDIPSVTFNNRETVREMVKKLYLSGRRRFVYVGQPTEGPDNLIERYGGFTDALAEYNDVEMITIFDEALHINKPRFAYELFNKKIMHYKPDAIVTSHDLIAQGIINAAHSAGLNIPKDIAVTGFDNMLLSEYLIPSITTVHQDADMLAYKCFELLIKQINKEDVESFEIKQSIIQRDSAKF